MKAKCIPLFLVAMVICFALSARAQGQAAAQQTASAAGVQEGPSISAQDRVAELERRIAEARSAGDNAWMLSQFA